MAYPQQDFSRTTFHGQSMLGTRRQTVARTTVKMQLDMLKKTGRFDCFKLQWHPIYEDHSQWPVPKHLFWDSDCAKWMEGACYLLYDEYDEEIDAAIQELVVMIRAAQREDGYLNLHYIVVDPQGRWSNLRDMHELYNAGHLIEAALAHHSYYKNTLLLEPIEKYVDLIYNTFGPEDNKRHGYPGHPEIELALLRLYDATGNEKALKLARYFLEERGNPTGQDGKHYYQAEADERGESPWERPDSYPVAKSHWYSQAHQPILKQETIEGHSVRAMYLLTAVADLIRFDRTTDWFPAVNKLWNNMVDKKMYLTGGIGAIHEWEGFGIDYFLPQGSDEGGAYAETCASIGTIMLAERLLHHDCDSRYADVMELCLYNAVMTSMGLEGRSFTYHNQLASSGKHASTRETWFECSCCPPNVTRLFGSLGGYLWDHTVSANEATIIVHLYTTARLAFHVGEEEVSLEQKSDWPWDGKIDFRLDVAPHISVTLKLRLPGWSNGKFRLTPPLPSATIDKGYISLSADYLATHPSFTLEVYGLEPRFVAPHPYTHQNIVAMARGPIVYCLEDVDNPWEENHFKDTVVSQTSVIREERRTSEISGEPYVALHTNGSSRSLNKWEEKPKGHTPGTSWEDDTSGIARSLCFVPYYYRANRGGRGQMRVGLLRP